MDPAAFVPISSRVGETPVPTQSVQYALDFRHQARCYWPNRREKGAAEVGVPFHGSSADVTCLSLAGDGPWCRIWPGRVVLLQRIGGRGGGAERGGGGGGGGAETDVMREAGWLAVLI